jgi:hypothetical protein
MPSQGIRRSESKTDLSGIASKHPIKKTPAQPQKGYAGVNESFARLTPPSGDAMRAEPYLPTLKRRQARSADRESTHFFWFMARS